MSPEGLVEESHRYQIMTGLACGAVPKRLMLESSPVVRPPVCFPASRGSGNRNLALIGIPRAQGHLMLPSSRSSHLCATGASAGEKPLIGDELDAAGARRGPLCAHPPPRARMLHLIGRTRFGRPPRTLSIFEVPVVAAAVGESEQRCVSDLAISHGKTLQPSPPAHLAHIPSDQNTGPRWTGVLGRGVCGRPCALPMIEAVCLAQGEPATDVCMSGAEMSMIMLLSSWPVPRTLVMVVGERALSHRLTRWRSLTQATTSPPARPHLQPQPPPCRLIARNGRFRHVVVSTVYPC